VVGRIAAGTEGLGCGLEGCVGQAGDQVTVAVHVVDAGGGGPELGLAHPHGREGGLLAAVRALPLVRQDHVGCVGGVLQDVVVPARPGDHHSM
jgi:hypothetical protein